MTGRGVHTMQYGYFWMAGSITTRKLLFDMASSRSDRPKPFDLVLPCSASSTPFLLSRAARSRPLSSPAARRFVFVSFSEISTCFSRS